MRDYSPLIEFELFQPLDIEPWLRGDDNNAYLSGYQLSQGYLRLNVGNQTLMEYSPEIWAHWGAEPPSFADQLLWRIHMDLVEDLGKFLEPIPRDLEWWMMPQRDTPCVRWIALCMHAWNSHETVDCSFLADRIRDALAGRSLPFDRLVEAPDISIWASDDEVVVGWDNRAKLVDGIPVWTAQQGTQRFARDDFLAEIRDFRDRYFDAMRRQLALVRGGLVRQGVQVDIERDELTLGSEQARKLSEYLSTPFRGEPVNWDAVRSALKQTLDLTGLKLT